MIQRFFTNSWAIEPRYHERMALVVLRGHLAMVNDSEKERVLPRYELSSSSEDSHSSKAKTDDKRVAIIPLIGTMSRYGDWCSYGTEDISQWVMEANADDRVIGIVMEMNSPGGEVDGTELLAEVVRQSGKPVVCYVSGMAASAAYWVASQSDWIVMESAVTSEVGSIGVLAMHVDARKSYEKAGYQVTIIRAEGSENKALFNSVEPISEELIQAVRDEMKPIRTHFLGSVRAGRPSISEKVFDGRMHAGQEAIGLGMADQIGYLGDAILKVVELAN